MTANNAVNRPLRSQSLATPILTIFTISGATSLVYQVTWARTLSLFFGSDVFAAATTLSVFMGGLALGSWGASRIGDRLVRPLLAYGLCEVLIAVSALLVPDVLALFGEAYASTYEEHFETRPWAYHAFRVCVASAALLPPTVFMGATLPFVTRQFADRNDTLGRRVGYLYAYNTIGALLGTVLAGFVALPVLGSHDTVLSTASINIVIGLVALVLAFQVPTQSNRVLAARASAPRRPLERSRLIVQLVMALSGFAALALEVVWIRILIQSFSATVYAFSIMLASFLFGIFYGSHLAAQVVDKRDQPLRLLIMIEFWLAAAVSIAGLATFGVPAVFGALIWGLTAITGGEFGIANVVAQAFVAFLVICLPTTLLGTTFAAAVKAATTDITRRAAAAGSVYAANTAGALLGALVAGFVLIPTLGGRASLVVVAGLFLCAGFVAILLCESISVYSWRIWLPGGIAIGISAVILMMPTQTIVNYNLQRSSQPEVLYHGEGVSHTVDIVRNERNHIIMMVDGNVEADTTLTQRRHFIMKAHVPLLLHARPREVAVIGLGLGITLRATARHPTVERIRIIELAPEMVRAHRNVGQLAGDILDDLKLNLRIDDGRNFMAMSKETFDMVTADPIHPRITGVGYLYTREYYELTKRRLRTGSVVAQWMPMYQISPRSFDVAFRTFASVYPNASFWYVRGHGLFVATVNEFTVDFESFARRFEDPRVKEDFASIGIQTPQELLGYLLMDAERIRRYVARTGESIINTDDNAYLEYRTPFEMLGRTEHILADLLSNAGWNVADVLRNASDDVKSEVRREFQRRIARIRLELSEPVD